MNKQFKLNGISYDIVVKCYNHRSICIYLKNDNFCREVTISPNTKLCSNYAFMKVDISNKIDLEIFEGFMQEKLIKINSISIVDDNVLKLLLAFNISELIHYDKKGVMDYLNDVNTFRYYERRGRHFYLERELKNRGVNPTPQIKETTEKDFEIWTCFVRGVCFKI